MQLKHLVEFQEFILFYFLIYILNLILNFNLMNAKSVKDFHTNQVILARFL